MSPPATDGGTELAECTDANTALIDVFDFDIKFIENTPAAETQLACSTGDNCGTSCGSACTTS